MSRNRTWQTVVTRREIRDGSLVYEFTVTAVVRSTDFLWLVNLRTSAGERRLGSGFKPTEKAAKLAARRCVERDIRQCPF